MRLPVGRCAVSIAESESSRLAARFSIRALEVPSTSTGPIRQPSSSSVSNAAALSGSPMRRMRRVAKERVEQVTEHHERGRDIQMPVRAELHAELNRPFFLYRRSVWFRTSVMLAATIIACATDSVGSDMHARQKQDFTTLEKEAAVALSPENEFSATR